jgi:hypothetical protein
MFGSFSNGFKTGGSDLDILFSGTVPAQLVRTVLSTFANDAPKYGFTNITKIFSASVPIVKLTDKKSQMEVDFCINNDLGVRNSLLLNAYTRYDKRVLKLGRIVKDWAKKHELVGTADGCLNSYAYMLFVLHYLQQLSPPVVPNLQKLGTDSVPIVDNKWGADDTWETKFLEEMADLPKSENSQGVGELLIGFFHYYTQVFDFRKHAVCMRQCEPNAQIDKYSLTTPTNDEQWYVEDPFDLKHNLAGKCTRKGRSRILEQMGSSLKFLNASGGGGWKNAFPEDPHELFFLKCRISQGVEPQALLEAFEEFDLVKLHFPKSDGVGRLGQAFLEFREASARRRAHTKNEAYVADCQLQLHYSSQAGLADAIEKGQFSSYEMASYKFQKKVLKLKAAGTVEPSRPAGDMSQSQQAFQDMPPMPMPPMSMMPPYAFPPGMRAPFSYPPHLPPQPPPGYPVAFASFEHAKRLANVSEEPMVKAPPKNGEAKAKDGKAAKQPVAKVKNQTIASMPTSKPSRLKVKIKNEMPRDTLLLTPEYSKILDDQLEGYLQQFKTDVNKPKHDRAKMQCELHVDLAPESSSTKELQQIDLSKLLESLMIH